MKPHLSYLLLIHFLINRILEFVLKLSLYNPTTIILNTSYRITLLLFDNSGEQHSFLPPRPQDPTARKQRADNAQWGNALRDDFSGGGRGGGGRGGGGGGRGGGRGGGSSGGRSYSR